MLNIKRGFVMKKAFLCIFVVLAVMFATGCPEALGNSDLVTVYFLNDSESLAIESFQLQTGEGTWGTSLIPTGQTIPPNNFIIKELGIPLNDQTNFRIKISGYTDYITHYDFDDDSYSLCIEPYGFSPTYCFVYLVLEGDVPKVTGFSGGDPTYWEDDIGTTYTQVIWQ
jgi:hypothetical protein